MRKKVRLGLGLKHLAWASVNIPVIMPKPDLTALTGGYRKTPVLQIGADIYCRPVEVIMRELERRHPNPSFYPASRGAADALAWWSGEDDVQPGRQHRLRPRGPTHCLRVFRRPDQVRRPEYRSCRNYGGSASTCSTNCARVSNGWIKCWPTAGRSCRRSAPGLADLAAYHPA